MATGDPVEMLCQPSYLLHGMRAVFVPLYDQPHPHPETFGECYLVWVNIAEIATIKRDDRKVTLRDGRILHYPEGTNPFDQTALDPCGATV